MRDRNRLVVVAADPAWQSDDKVQGERGAAHKYQTMTVREIEQMELPREVVEARHAVLFLWRLATMQLEALRVALAWNFDPRNGELVWRKLTKNGKPHVGMGRILRGSHETAIIAARGASAARVPAVKNVLSIQDWDLSTTIPAEYPWEDRLGVFQEADTFEAVAPYDPKTGKAIHSAKPEEFFQLLELLFPEAIKVELFARKERAGWIQHGNELGSRG